MPVLHCMGVAIFLAILAGSLHSDLKDGVMLAGAAASLDNGSALVQQ